MKDIRFLKCNECEQNHIEVDFSKLDEDQLAGRKAVLENYFCNRIAKMYRVGGFAFDLRVNTFKSNIPGDHQDQMRRELILDWGENNFEEKIQRFINLDLAFMGVPDEYYQLLHQVIKAYVCGNFYPAQTSAGALGERLLNRLLIRTREYFKSSNYYKKIYRKNSFDNWDLPIEALRAWGVISSDVAQEFVKLKQYRNDSIHYNDGYDFENNSPKAITILANIINMQFNYLQRKDLFWIFNVPGEIWVRSNALEQPFVKEFIIPHCFLLTPYCEPTANPPIKGNRPIGNITDEEFIKLRNERMKT